MADTTSEAMAPQADGSDAGRMPTAAKWIVFASVAALLGGAIALLALRGNALLLDLSTMTGQIFCL